MLHAFNIYPALLVLTPVNNEETVSADHRKHENEWSSEHDRYFPSCPQTYWGDCVFNENHTQINFGTAMDAEACPVQETLCGKSNVLEPAKFKGKRYTITYVPVLN